MISSKSATLPENVTWCENRSGRRSREKTGGPAVKSGRAPRSPARRILQIRRQNPQRRALSSVHMHITRPRGPIRWKLRHISWKCLWHCAMSPMIRGWISSPTCSIWRPRKPMVFCAPISSWRWPGPIEKSPERRRILALGSHRSGMEYSIFGKTLAAHLWRQGNPLTGMTKHPPGEFQLKKHNDNITGRNVRGANQVVNPDR